MEEKSVLVNGEAKNVFRFDENIWRLDENSYLTNAQVKIAQEVNLRIDCFEFPCFNRYVSSLLKIKRNEKRKSLGNKKYLAVNLAWGDSKHNQKFGISLGYNPEQESLVLNWIDLFVKDFPLNTSSINKIVEYINNAPYPEYFSSITTTSGFYESTNWELVIDTYDGVFISLVKHLVNVYPFF